MHDHTKLTSRSVNQIAWRRGYRGVAGLARALGVHRVSVFRAANPKTRLTGLRKRIEAALHTSENHA
ncbi:MAG: hypothetical protein KIT22_15325 [Verrucomicrobiae bacterium]|nr:hypothetical protein [Verrucomicrobiae bacterium]